MSTHEDIYLLVKHTLETGEDVSEPLHDLLIELGYEKIANHHVSPHDKSRNCFSSIGRTVTEININRSHCDVVLALTEGIIPKKYAPALEFQRFVNNTSQFRRQEEIHG